MRPLSPASGSATFLSVSRLSIQPTRTGSNHSSPPFSGHTHSHDGKPCTSHHHEHDIAAKDKKPNWLSRSFHAVGNWMERFYQQLKDDLQRLSHWLRGQFSKEKRQPAH